MTITTFKILVDGDAFDYIKLIPRHKPHFDCIDKKSKDSQCLQKFLDKRAL